MTVIVVGLGRIVLVKQGFVSKVIFVSKVVYLTLKSMFIRRSCFYPEESVPKDSNFNNSLSFVTDVAIKTGRENIYIIYALKLYKEEKK